MSILPLVLLVAVLAADAGYGLVDWRLSSQPMAVVFLAVAPTVFLVGLSWWNCALAARRVTGQQVDPALGLRGTSAIVRLCRSLIMLNGIVVVLFTDWLELIRQHVGEFILLDELIAMSPALMGVYCLGLGWYSIDRALSAWPSPGVSNRAWPGDRWRFAWSQFSVQVLLVFVPAVLILVVVEILGNLEGSQLDPVTAQLILLLAVFIIFLGTPLVARLLLSLQPLEAGDLRDRLEAACRVHGVRIRDILNWRTRGRLVNAAVIGIVGRLRYVLMTDTLVQSLPDRYTEAVMAHEIGHVRCRHMPWLFLVIVSLVLVVEAALLAVPRWPQGEGVLHLVVLLGAVWCGFGWVSRRFEWQADAFAAAHLARGSEEGAEAPSIVSLEAVATVIGALEAIVILNGDSPRRFGWRHGSMARRCQLLSDLAGRPRGSLPIDTVVGRIKIAAVILGGVALAILLTLGSMDGNSCSSM